MKGKARSVITQKFRRGVGPNVQRYPSGLRRAVYAEMKIGGDQQRRHAQIGFGSLKR